MPEKGLLTIDNLRPRYQKKRRLFDRMALKRTPAIVLDPEKCTGCHTCEMVCSSRKGAPVSPSSASIKVIRDDGRGKVFAIFCQQCREPNCMEVCPTKAIEKCEDGIVRISQRLCVHCGLCTMACPEAAPLIDPKNGEVRKCDLCNYEPLCAEYCPEQAISLSRGKALGWIRLLRWPVQIVAFLLLVIILVGTFCALRAGEFQLSCPLGVLQNIFSSKTVILMSVFSGLILIILTIIGGRIFCGWLCPFGFVLDLFGKLIPKKKWLPSFLRTRTAKYGVFAASIGGSYALGFQAFCTVCPIGTLCRSHGVQGFFRGYELAIVPALVGLESSERRSWCRYFCPVGALLALTARLGLIRVVIGAHRCKKFSCMQCAEVCPMGIVKKEALAEGISPEVPMTECTLCMRCIDSCPYGASKIRFRWQKVVPAEVTAWVG
jgi:NapH/MauN family ferredoxin-type protein